MGLQKEVEMIDTEKGESRGEGRGGERCMHYLYIQQF